MALSLNQHKPGWASGVRAGDCIYLVRQRMCVTRDVGMWSTDGCTDDPKELGCRVPVGGTDRCRDRGRHTRQIRQIKDLATRRNMAYPPPHIPLDMPCVAGWSL
jgi:hypothetical protein